MAAFLFIWLYTAPGKILLRWKIISRAAAGQLGAMMNDDLPQSRFTTTIWSEVVRASQPEREAGQRALNALLSKYRGPLLTHLTRRVGLPSTDAEDLLHDFVHDKVMVKRLIGRAARERGRFRSFLLTSLVTFVKEKARNEARLKRRPKGGWASFADLSEAELDGCAHTPANTFDEDWARAVMTQTIRLMEAECRARNQEEVWGVFRFRLLLPILEGAEKVSYEELIQRFKFASVEQLSNALTTAKRKFIRILKEQIGEYEGDPAKVEAEFRELKSILANAGERLPV